ncbi:MAG: AraC family transcriptional regulator [Bacteroidaceae bacterium]|uniref:AraC family transcriptional regulator n=1 Tax=unclassified Bacteroides TaxID=2646097 RepID=UPI0004E18652|nr:MULTISPECIES: helix-turn-helix domain-containing protein [unclassified Bacteroides]MBP3244335.1 AraC family transcriptional regulator [Bacteroidaceae bacterium]MBQ1675843.1 AraC family transcriptional regulator [Bacteroidaceae bacterium]MBQ3772713.1 AraC family transcriptional regulator [Bacteroidaceae bacterium]MBQ3874793.1 AraC family transcriptional regulator [Bacteroidaceae bacterium]MBQ5351123.1 AraC family transcriptional regulator [Bacteroidaceae bacterium]
MELTIYQYSFLLFGLFSLALGLTMLVCWPTGSFKLSKYRDSKIMFGVTFTAISVGNCFRMYNSAFGETPQVYADFLSPYVISLILMFIILFGYSILALYRSEHIGIRTALADVGITAVAILVYFVHERNNIMEIYDLDYFLTHIGEFAMYWRVVMLAVAVFLFLKYAILIESTRKKFKEIIDMFFSEAERYSLPWVRSAFYGAIMVGILAIVCVAVNSQTLFVFFVVVLLTFMFIFVVSYLMYPITYFDISSVIEAPESLRMRLEEEMGSTEKIDEKIEKWKQRRGYTQFNINVVRMSEDVICSQVAILNYLKRANISFYDWIGKMRMQEAKKRMLEEKKNTDLGDLSFELGYSSYHVFVREFVKREGTTPSQWIEKNTK